MIDCCTKEQFGVALYDAVYLIGRILGVQNQRRQAPHKYAERAARQVESALRAQLQTQMDRLTDAEAAAVVRRYPWVMT